MTCVPSPAAGGTTRGDRRGCGRDRGRLAQRPGERRAVGEPVRRGLGQRAAYDARQVGRHRAGELGHRVAEVGDGGGDRGVGDEGLAAGQALEGDDPERVDVGRGRRRAPLGLLGRDVGGRAHHLAGLREGHPVRGAGDAEVGDLDPAVGGDEEVGGLDVAVDDAGGVGHAECLGRLGEQVAGRVGVERRAGPQQRRERLALDELHHEVGARGRGAVVERAGAVVVDRRDAGVLERGGVPGLGLEPLPERRVVGVLRLEHLDRHRPVEHGVARGPHLAHAAGGDAGLEDVAAGLVDVAAGCERRHGVITASMTALAIGPPRTPPPISSGEVSLDCTSTATATLGSLAGAKETNHA